MGTITKTNNMNYLITITRGKEKIQTWAKTKKQLDETERLLYQLGEKYEVSEFENKEVILITLAEQQRNEKKT